MRYFHENCAILQAALRLCEMTGLISILLLHATLCQLQQGEQYPFIEEIVNMMPTIICDLEPQQVQTFYEAIGYMIAVHDDLSVCSLLKIHQKVVFHLDPDENEVN